VKLMVTIESEDSALSLEPHEGSAELLEEIASKLRYGLSDGRLQDNNGNTVGRWWLTINDQ